MHDRIIGRRKGGVLGINRKLRFPLVIVFLFLLHATFSSVSSIISSIFAASLLQHGFAIAEIIKITSQTLGILLVTDSYLAIELVVSCGHAVYTLSPLKVPPLLASLLAIKIIA